MSKTEKYPIDEEEEHPMSREEKIRELADGLAASEVVVAVDMRKRTYTVVVMRNHSGFPSVKEEIAPADLTDARLDYYGIHVSAEIALRALDRGAAPFHGEGDGT